MRRTRFMSWFFLMLSLAFFAVRDFRFALEAPLGNRWYSNQTDFNNWPPKPSKLSKLYTLDRYVSTTQFLSLAEEAVHRGDNNFVAFAALELPLKEARNDVMRLGDKAVAANHQLTWIYLPLASRFMSEADGEHDSKESEGYIESRINLLESFDPQNAVPHLLRAQFLQKRRGRSWPRGSGLEPQYLNGLAEETEWRKEMQAAFDSPRFDSYEVQHFDLVRKVMRGRGWDQCCSASVCSSRARALSIS